MTLTAMSENMVGAIMSFNMSHLLLWETEDGIHDWKALASTVEVTQFLEQLLKSGVDPAKIMTVPMSLYWMFPQYHNNKRSAMVSELVDEGALERLKQEAREKEYLRQQGAAERPVPDVDTDLGWLSPDGRFFKCGYGGHAQMAREIAGKMAPTKDAQTFLENNGWFAIYESPVPGKSLGIGSGTKGKNRHLNEKQLGKIQQMGIADKIFNLIWYL